jgi:hypothetical protein
MIKDRKCCGLSATKDPRTFELSHDLAASSEPMTQGPKVLRLISDKAIPGRLNVFPHDLQLRELMTYQGTKRPATCRRRRILGTFEICRPTFRSFVQADDATRTKRAATCRRKAIPGRSSSRERGELQVVFQKDEALDDRWYVRSFKAVVGVGGAVWS